MAINIEPRSLAVIGASRDKEKIGYVLLKNILDGGYKGKVYPVNLHARRILNQEVFKTVTDIPDKVDMAVIAIPAAYVLNVLEECGMKGIKSVVVISAGFSEVGSNGLELELKLVETAKKFQIEILGPNCLGFINSKVNLNASFALTSAGEGNIAFISQSGAMGTSFLDWAAQEKIGLSHFISIGNKSIVNENFFLEKFGQDPNVKTILLYLEDFADGRGFYEAAAKISKDKPVIVLKPGSSKSAVKAMASHTGSIAQDDKIIDAALLESGCIRVRTIEELFSLTKLFAWEPLLKGNRVAVVTNAGGVGIQTVDDLENNGLRVVPFSKKLEKELLAALPEESSVANPVDLLGDALAERYGNALDLLMQDDSIDAVMVLLTPQMMTQSLETARYVNELADKYNKVVLTSFIGGGSIEEAKQLLRKERIPQFDFPNDGAKTLGGVWHWRKYVAEHKKVKPTIYKPSLVNSELDWGSDNGVVYLNRAYDLFKSYDIPLLESYIRGQKQEIVDKAREIHFPVVVKLVHPKLIHKTEFKAVRLNIESEYQLQKELGELERLAKQNNLKGFEYELQPFIEDKVEVIIGVKKDMDTYTKHKNKNFLKSKGFGHVLVFGSGGIYTEVYKDVSLRLLPIDSADAEQMILETKVGTIIKGLRGKTYDFTGIINLLTNLSRLIKENTNITQIDINPLFVSQEDVYVADLKMFVT